MHGNIILSACLQTTNQWLSIVSWKCVTTLCTTNVTLILKIAVLQCACISDYCKCTGCYCNITVSPLVHNQAQSYLVYHTDSWRTPVLDAVFYNTYLCIFWCRIPFLQRGDWVCIESCFPRILQTRYFVCCFLMYDWWSSDQNLKEVTEVTEAIKLPCLTGVATLCTWRKVYLKLLLKLPSVILSKIGLLSNNLQHTRQIEG